jgi:hypothetical protein
MKSLLLTFILCFGGVAFAHGPGGYRPNYHYHNHHHHGSRADWIVPAIIGGVVVYAATRPVAPTVVYVPQNLPPAPIGFRYELIVDAACNCQRWVLVQGQ